MEKTALDILLDENCDDNFFLYDLDDKKIEFEQHAIIPLDDKIYCIAKPVEPLEGMEDDEAIVFLIDEEKEELIEIVDEEIIEKLFVEYDKL
ncbi:hypothetical protein J6Y73_05360 [bacterium]|nr:hypothetical protein [bacterium]